MKNTLTLKQMWPAEMKWQDQVYDWSLCDALAKVYTRILVVAPDQVYAALKRWNSDDNLWKRRQSVVSILYYSRKKRTFCPLLKSMGLSASY